MFKELPFCMVTAQKMKFPIKDFFRKCDQIRQKLLVWPHLLKKYLMGNFIFCAVGFSDSKPVAKTNLQHKTKYLDVNPFMVIDFTCFICL